MQRWLLPLGLPPASSFTCPRCDGRMCLLTQIYAPLDAADVGHAQAFHRMLYVFGCPSPRCVNRASDNEVQLGRPSLRVLRAQLPEHNPLMEGGSMSTAYARLASSMHACRVCGIPAPHRCSRCTKARYCSQAHALLDWKVGGHKEVCKPPSCAVDASLPVSADERTAAAAFAAAAILPRWEIVVEEEPGPEERHAAEVRALPTNAAKAYHDALTDASSASAHASTATMSKTAASGACTGGASSSGLADVETDASQLSIEGLSQRKLAEITGSRIDADACMRYFLRRVAVEPEQVLRYCRWPEHAADEVVWLAEHERQLAREVARAKAKERSVRTNTSQGGGTVALVGGVEESKDEDAAGDADEARGDVDSIATDEDEACSDIDDHEPHGAPLWVSETHLPDLRPSA
ncbi:MAG: hypothetical protein EOO41_00245, partial [Methanobacteriota archaeon]